jgi:hypothetical protein
MNFSSSSLLRFINLDIRKYYKDDGDVRHIFIFDIIYLKGGRAAVSN